MGRKANNIGNPKERNRILWEKVPFKKGKVEAIAYIGGKEVARHNLSTFGDAKRLTATPDNSAWKADGMDLQHVRIAAVDSKGLTDKKASGLLTFKVDGPADIVGVINGDMKSDELSVGNTRSLFNGAATVILRSRKDTPGKVTLTVSTPGLPTRSVALTTAE